MLEKADEKGERGEKGRREKRRVSHGCHLVEGKMKHGMEDYLVATCKKIEAKQVSVDHEPLKEKKMVESKGGFVSQRAGTRI